jgi:hypothetical protein
MMVSLDTSFGKVPNYKQKAQGSVLGWERVI